MVDFKIIKGKTFSTLDITELRHIFVTEDETCAEVRITKDDAKRLLKAVADFIAGDE